MIGAAAGITVAENFIQAALATFKSKGLPVIGSEDPQRNPIDNAAGGQKSMQGILQTVPDANAVLAYNDDSALGAISAAKAAHKDPGKAIYIGSRNGGPDAVAAVKAGTLMVSCDVDPIGFGQKIGQAAVDQVTGKHDYENAVKIAPLSSKSCLIDKDTVGSYVNWTDRIKYAKLTEK
jgi:ribose transport system substrate-binding protein